MSGEPTLATGDTGEWVTYLQQLLTHLGMGGGLATGVFDATTADAVRQVQQRYSLPATGTCDEPTWAVLVGAAYDAAPDTTGTDPRTDGQASADTVGSPSMAGRSIEFTLEHEVAATDPVDVDVAQAEQLPGHVEHV